MIDIPIIDIASNPKGMGEACRAFGFFRVTGHGISPEMIARVWRVSEQFFALPMADKRKLSRTFDNTMGYFDRELTKTKRDQKEIFDFIHTPYPSLPDDHPDNVSVIDGVNRWPSELPEFKQVLKEYFAACIEVAHGILEMFCFDLGIDSSFFRTAFGSNHSSFMRLNHYPTRDVLTEEERQDARQLGDKALHHHTDAGVLTLLLQDNTGGLQVKVGDDWIDVPPLEGTFVVNVGDLMQIWSNDTYKAVEHRVRQVTNNSRYSIPLFLNPAYETVCEPILQPGEIPVYRPVKWGDFRAKRAEGDFDDYGEEIQISSFRL